MGRRREGQTSASHARAAAPASYSTRWYRAPDASRWPSAWWWKGICIDPKEPDHLTACVLFPVKNGRWTVTLAGLAGELSAGIQEVVGRRGWARGNTLVLIVTGAGHRTARAFDEGVAGAPLLHVEYR